MREWEVDSELKVVPVIPRAFEERLRLPAAEGLSFLFLFL